jgi:hypothetical protein
MAEPPRFSEGVYNKSTKPRPIEKLPFLGTTWYTRGAAYWFRRVLASVLMLIGLTAATAITAGLVGAIVQSNSSIAIKFVALVVIASAIIASTLRAFKAFFRVERNRKIGRIFRPDFDSQAATSKGRRHAGVAAIVAAITRTGSLIAGALLVVSVVFCFGWFIVLFLWTLQRELGVEHDARIRLEQRQGNQSGHAEPSA